MSKLMSRLVLFVAAAAVLSACASRRETLAYVERPVENIYLEGYDYMHHGNYQRAALHFDEVERQHPYSEWARRAMLMSIFAYYQDNRYDDAIVTAQRFVALHPGNRNAAYAQYLVGLSYYERILDVGRDQQITAQAMEALEQLNRRYPGTEYAKDASLKIDMTRDHLAGKEMQVGRWYQKRRQYVAAINRFRQVIDNYQTTSHVPEALHRLVESYLAMGVVPEATKIAAVLGYNFPGSEWYEDSYALLITEGALTPEFDPEHKNRGYFRRLTDRLF